MNDYDDTAESPRRFYALMNRERAARGLPPISEPKPELPPKMRMFMEMNRNGSTESFLAMNEERLANGLPPLGANGRPIEPKVPAQAESTIAPSLDDFPGDYSNVVVKRYNK